MAKTYAFIDEAGRSCVTGKLKDRQPYFIVGVLLTNRPDDLLAAIRGVRESQRFFHEIHWTKQGSTRVAAYRAVAEAVRRVGGWEYKATRFLSRAVDLRYFSGLEHLAYNRFVRMAVDSALKYPKIAVYDDLDFTIDQKSRVNYDNFLEYISFQFGTVLRMDEETITLRDVTVRESDSKTNDLLQLCDLFSGALHSRLTPDYCGPRKYELAGQVWLPGKCREWEPKLAKAQNQKAPPG